MNSSQRCCCLPGLLVILVGCSQEDRSGSVQAGSRDRVGPLEVYVVNYPLQYFAQRIGGDLVKVVMPVPRDVDPAFWKPDNEAILEYQQADLILLNGARYAKWVRNATLPRSRVVDTSVSFRDRLIKVQDAVTHGHGPKGEHSHASTAFTTWLDPALAIQQARAILEAFRSRWPMRGKRFEENFRELKRDLVALDRRTQAVVTKDTSRPLFVSHPVYQYWTRRYGLNVKSVHWEPDEMPSPAAWKELEQMHAGHPAKWMIWEGSPIADATKRLAAMGIQSVVVRPCANRPVTGDYLQVMTENLAALSRVFAN